MQVQIIMHQKLVLKQTSRHREPRTKMNVLHHKISIMEVREYQSQTLAMKKLVKLWPGALKNSQRNTV